VPQNSAVAWTISPRDTSGCSNHGAEIPWWVIGPGVDVVAADLAEGDLQGAAPAAPWCGGEDGAAVGEHRGRGARAGEGARKVSIASGPVMVGRARLARARREWSSNRLRISASVPSARCQWVVSACQSSLGWAAVSLFQADRGRLWGWGTMKPRRARMRQIVDRAGTFVTSGSRARCSAMVAAPAS
jgi:hypothetical protein